ncbi:MAG: hypothetical protein ACJ73N_07670 [Bryobacteraceae bacterium]
MSTAATSEAAAGTAMLGHSAITGKLPVSIPPMANVGDGLDVPVRPTAASNGSE